MAWLLLRQKTYSLEDNDNPRDLERGNDKIDEAPNLNPTTSATSLQGPGTLVLFYNGQQLAGSCHNTAQRTVLGLPGQNVTVVRGYATPAQVATQRPSYINALLIQSRGVAVNPACSACVRSQSMSVDGLARPFPACRRLAGHFGGCCGNAFSLKNAVYLSKSSSVIPLPQTQNASYLSESLL